VRRTTNNNGLENGRGAKEGKRDRERIKKKEGGRCGGDDGRKELGKWERTSKGGG
jgi:hypothetical protein